MELPKYFPGLVGGHCIGVDPYYLTYKAKEIGHNTKLIVAGREINNYMHEYLLNQINIEISRRKKFYKKMKRSFYWDFHISQIAEI